MKILVEGRETFLTKQLLRRNQRSDLQRLQRIRTNLSWTKFSLFIPNESAFIKCLYPQKTSSIMLDDHVSITTSNVYKIGLNFLNFKRLEFDSKLKKDFIDSFSNLKSTSNDKLLKFILKKYRLVGIARLNMPNDRIPERIRLKLDQAAMITIIGYLSLVNNGKGLDQWVKSQVFKPFTQHKFL